jgi:hypothetical protein
LANVHNFNPPTPTLEKGKKFGIGIGVDFSFKQHDKQCCFCWINVGFINVHVSSMLSIVVNKELY